MSASAIVVGSAALAYLLLRQRQASADSALVDVETHADLEHPPNTWTEALYIFKEAMRYVYLEALGKWTTMDLFLGLAYISNQESDTYPAADIVQEGNVIEVAELNVQEGTQLLDDLKNLRRLMLYCQGLRYQGSKRQLHHWQNHLDLDPSNILLHHPTAGLLRPTHAIIKDPQMKKILLCIRGTTSLKDMFTSLTGAVKPHHQVCASGVVLGYSHLGMLAAARWILSRAAPDLRRAASEHPGYGVHLVGHSMGAGTAALVAMMLREKYPELGGLTCTAIACPACLTANLAEECAGFVTTYIHGADLVPCFCAASVEHLRREVAQSSWFAQLQKDMRVQVNRMLFGGATVVNSVTSWTSRSFMSTAGRPFKSCARPPSKSWTAGTAHSANQEWEELGPSGSTCTQSLQAPQLQAPVAVDAERGSAQDNAGQGAAQVIDGAQWDAVAAETLLSSHVRERVVGGPHSSLKQKRKLRSGPECAAAPEPREPRPPVSPSQQQQQQQQHAHRDKTPPPQPSSASLWRVALPPRGPGAAASLNRMGSQVAAYSSRTAALVSSRLGSASQSAGQWVSAGLFKGCANGGQPRPVGGGAAAEREPLVGDRSMDTQQAPAPGPAPVQRGGDTAAGAWDEGGPKAEDHDLPASGQSQPDFGDGISAVIAAVNTDEKSHEKEACAAERILEETQDTPTTGDDASVASDGEGATDGAASTSDDGAAGGGQSEGAAPQSRARQLYPGGRILHLVPRSALAGPSGPRSDGEGGDRVGGAQDQAGGVRAEVGATSGGSSDGACQGPQAGHASVPSGGNADEEYVLVEIQDRCAYGRLRLSRNMVRDHFIPSYMKALDNVIQQLDRHVGGAAAQ